MKEEIEAFLYALSSAWRYRWAGLTCAWLLFVFGAIGIALLPNRYESKALVYVNTTSSLKPLLQGIAVSSDPTNDADFVRRIVLARPTLDRVANETGLYKRLHGDEDQADKLLAQLSNDIKISGNRDGFYSIAYVDQSPRMSQVVVERLLSTFVDSSKNAGRTDADAASGFLTEQVKEYEQRLSQSEQKLADFKTKNISLLPGTAGDYFQRLASEELNQKQLVTDLRVAMQQRSELLRKMSGDVDESGKPPPQPSAAAISGAVALDARIEAAERQLDDSLQKNTENHPDVIALRANIALMKQRRAKEFRTVRASSMSMGTSTDATGVARTDTVLQDIQIGLNKQDVQIAALKTQLDAANERVDTLQKMVATAPQVEAEYTQLNRDYGVTKAEYEQLLQRLESAKISGDASADEGGTHYKLVEPPRLPVRPIAPRRTIFLAAVLFLAVVAGAALAWLLSQAKPVYMDARAIKQTFNLQLIGVVSLAGMSDDLAQRRRLRAVYVLCVLGLLACAVVAKLVATPSSALLRGALSLGST